MENPAPLDPQRVEWMDDSSLVDEPLIPKENHEQLLEIWDNALKEIIEKHKNITSESKQKCKKFKFFYKVENEVENQLFHSDDKSTIKPYFEHFYAAVKLITPLNSIVLNGKKWMALRKAKSELEQLNQMGTIPFEKIAARERKLKREQSKTNQKIKKESSFFLKKVLELAHSQFKKCSKLWDDITREHRGIQESKKGHQIYQDWSEKLQNFEANDSANLKQCQANHEARLFAHKQKFDDFITQINSLPLEELKKALVEKHIHLDECQLEGLQGKLADGEFRIQLCNEWVEYIETTEQLIKQGAVATLLKKIEVDSTLMDVKYYSHLLGLFFVGLRTNELLPGMQQALEQSMMSYLINDVPLPFMGLMKILLPKCQFTTGDFFLLTAGFSINYYYKPNEFSLKGCTNQARIYWSEFKSDLEMDRACLKFYLNHFILFLQIHFVEKLILKIQPAVADPRYDQIRDQFDADKAAVIRAYEELTQQLNELRIKDLNYNLQPNAVFVKGPEGDIPYEPIQHLLDAMNDPEITYLKKTVDAFKEHFGVDLEKQNRDEIIAQMKQMLASDPSFFYKCREEILVG
ncbi:MAG: hypothetical protein LW832_06450 [Parachlamydia sp.]|nr:hypothetical protein [Parachlamydia sp.]